MHPPHELNTHAHNAWLDAHWNDVKDTSAADITDRGFFFAEKVTDAFLPPALVATVMRRSKIEASNGMYLFVPEAVEGSGSRVMKITQKSRDYLDQYRKRRDLVPDRIPTDDPERVKPTSAMYRQYASIYGWPCLLYVWSDGHAIYIRKAFTEESWGRLDPRFRNYVRANRPLFGL